MPRPGPQVSVVVPVLNGGAAVKRAATSLLAQDYPGPPPEIIFVDNGSTDGGLDPLSAMPVTVLREPERGAGVARNHGAKAARGEIIAFLDCDCLAERRWLRNLVEAMSDGAPAVAGETIAQPAASWPARYLAHIRHGSSGVSLLRPVLPFASTVNLAVKRDLFDALGGFDASLPCCEDVDFSIRVRKAAGRPIAFVPKAIVFHEERGTARSLFDTYRGYGRGWSDLLLRHPAEISWGPGLAMSANFDVLRALFKVPAGFLKWKLGGADPSGFYFPWFDFLRRLAHRIGFFERSVSRGRLLW
jgi:GT2 family glycosyltransferase